MGVDARIRIKTKVPLTEAQLIDLGYQIRSRFEDIIVPRYFEWEVEKNPDNPPENAVLELATRYDDVKDEDVVADPCLYEVRAWCRYYGPDYERGPAIQLFGLIYYLNTLDNVIEVFYGGDSGEELEPFPTMRAVAQLLNHFCANAHEPYRRYLDKDNDGPMCCGHQMIRFGWGGNYAAWSCAGCGDVIEERDGVRTLKHKPD